MSIRITLATSRRVLQQLSHDPRTLALLFVVPCVLLTLLAWIYSDNHFVFDRIGAPLLAIFPMLVMFLVTSITTLRERASGALERLLALPVGKLDILLGYALSFGAIAVVQALVVSTLALYGLDLDVAGPQWFLMIVALVDALLGTALGLFVSAFARTEFQAVQFMPAFFMPQFLLCGLLQPVGQMPAILEGIARVLPLTHAVDAMQYVARNATLSSEAVKDVAIVLAFAVGAILLGAATLRRKTK